MMIMNTDEIKRGKMKIQRGNESRDFTYSKMLTRLAVETIGPPDKTNIQRSLRLNFGSSYVTMS